MSISSDLHDIFVKKGYLWKIGAERHVPSKEDIHDALDAIKSVMDNDPEVGSLEVGRIRVQRSEVGLEVYVYLGDL